MGQDGPVSEPLAHLRFAKAPKAEQERVFIALIRANPVNQEILSRIPELPLPQGMLVSGCLYQSVWNGLLGHEPTRGIRDYDLAYFDDSDLTYEAEDVVIKKCARAFADLGVEVEVRNQARVHVWFESHFGVPYSPLTHAAQSLERYMSPCNAVAAQPCTKDDLIIHAPFGLDDVFGFTVRPRGDGSEISSQSYAKKTTRMKALWPGLTIHPLRS
jgi:uncharacterized protein